MGVQEIYIEDVLPNYVERMFRAAKVFVCEYP